MAVIALGLTASGVRAQAVSLQTVADAAPAALVYDVASIKPNKSGTSQSSTLFSDNGTYTADNVTIKQLLHNASGLRQDLIFGLPQWTDNAHFDLTAKIVNPDPKALAALTQAQRRTMLQAMLGERFQLKWHLETKTLPVYELVMVKSGAKLNEATAQEQAGQSGISAGNTELRGIAASIARLADVLSDKLQRPVIDKTGLTSKYNFTLKWTREEDTAGQRTEAAVDDAPSIFTALQEQLGLKLQPAKGAVSTLVVDHVEMPSEN